MLSELSLEGKTALITGGSSGLGKAIGLVFAEAGADVAISARGLERLEEAAEEIRGLGRKVVAIQADVSDRQQVDEMISRASQDLGRIDILVNNAGGGGGGGPIIPLPEPPDDYHPEWEYRKPKDHTVGISDETWHRVLNSNLSSTFYCCRAVGPQMLQRRSGKIINIASNVATLAYPFSIAYQSAKTGVKMLTRVLANEWAGYNVNVNAIAPGWFSTEATRATFESPEKTKQVYDVLPLGRVGPNRDCGLLALYLASQASQYMTGQFIMLDGGESALYNV